MVGGVMHDPRAGVGTAHGASGVHSQIGRLTCRVHPIAGSFHTPGGVSPAGSVCVGCRPVLIWKNMTNRTRQISTPTLGTIQNCDQSVTGVTATVVGAPPTAAS